jgi:hypothetical protein
MNPQAVRIKLRCGSCQATAFLPPEHYRTLVKGSQLSLFCPHCAHQLVFNPTGFRARKAAALARKSPAEPGHSRDPVPLSRPAPARVSAPAFPPPPFAPLGVGPATPVSARTPTPPFAPMGGGPSVPAAPSPQRAEDPTGSEAKPLTLNERWKRLPQWQQWVFVGLTIVVLAIVIFALPQGGSGTGAAETAAPKPADTRPAMSGSDRPTDNEQSREPRKP